MIRSVTVLWGAMLLCLASFSPLYAADMADAWEMNARIGKGGNIKSQVTSKDPNWWYPWDNSFLHEIKAQGFDSVRMFMFPTYNDDASYNLPREFFTKWEQVIDAALEEGLVIIIVPREEHYIESLDQKARFLSHWRQIASYFKDKSENLIFELLNEPHGVINEVVCEEWMDAGVRTIRETSGNNRDRVLIVSGAGKSIPEQLDALNLSDYHQLIGTFHFYKPLSFTHQGELESSPVGGEGSTWSATVPSRKIIDDHMAIAYKFTQRTGQPVFMGEFGPTIFGASRDRLDWASNVSQIAELYDFSWSYFDLMSWDSGVAGTGGWDIYSPATNTWEDEMVARLIRKGEDDSIYGKKVTIENQYTGKALALKSESGSNNVSIVQKEYDGSDAMLWEIVPIGDNSCYIKNSYSGLVLRPYDAANNRDENIRIVQYPYTLGWQSELWRITSQNDVSYAIKNVFTGRALRPLSAGTSNGTPIIQYPYHATWGSQQWIISGAMSDTSFEDDFEDRNITEWTINDTGRWHVVVDGMGHELHGSVSKEANSRILVNNDRFSDTVIQADVGMDRADYVSFFIVARYQDDGNMYSLQFRNFNSRWTANLLKFVNGKKTILKSAGGFSLAANTTYQMRFSLNGSTLTGWLDGSALVTAEDSAFRSGQCGFERGVNYNVYIDDVTVSPAN